MIITYIIIAYSISATIALACALESIGFWKLEALAADLALQEARAEIDDDNIIIAWQRKQIGGHLKDNSVLLALNVYDERAVAGVVFAPGELADAVEEWLAGEEVAL